jgi:hypothetical protein
MLLIAINKFQKDEDFQNHINYYLTLIDKRGTIYYFSFSNFIETNRDDMLTFKGYVNHHSEYC